MFSFKPNPASPYCSYECRQLDGHGQSSSPSRLLPVYNNALSRTTTIREGSIRRKPSAPTASRPAFIPAQQRDRRAYSFPAAFAASPSLLDDESPPKTPAPTTLAAALPAPSSYQQLRFARRTQAVPVTYTSPRVDETTLTGKTPRRSRPPLLSNSLRQSSVPNVLPTESALCSTSEESDDEPAQELSVPSPTRAVTRPSLATQPTDKTNSTATTYASYLPPVLPLPARKSSYSRSPSAFLAATSASRSREDILSWAKAVGRRPRPSTHTPPDESDEVRGRDRDRRQDMEVDLPPIPPPGSLTPSSSSVEGDIEIETGVGTTPKGVAGLGSALFGLGFAPFITRKTPVAVAAVNVEETHMAIHPGGTTPTISTVSLSEVMEPSIGTDLENIDICNDENFTDCSRSGFQRSVPVPSYFQTSPKQPKQSPISPTTSTPTQQTSAPSPLKPIASTANALWSLSTYLRSFKPFSLAAALTPVAGPVNKAHDQSTILSPTPVTGLASVAMPARSPVVEDEVEDPKEMVKSLPMDIIPMGSRTAQQIGGEPKPDRRSHSRSRSRSPSSQALLGRGGKGLGVGRQRDNYSVKSSRASSLSNEDSAADDRGRSRRVIADPIDPVINKIAPPPLTPVGCLADLPPPVQEELEQEGRGRGRRRDLDSVSRGRSGSRGRKARGRAR